MSHRHRKQIKMHDLPQELIDKIIDCFHDNPRMLRRCSLVCWAWIPATRFHIFGSVTLRRWHRLVYPQFRPFIEMLAAPLCTFAPFVTHVVLEGFDSMPPQQWQHPRELNSMAPRPREFNPAFSVLPRLPALTALTFYGWMNLADQSVHHLAAAATLSAITLRSVQLQSVAQLFDMLELCPSLTDLTVVSTSWRPSNPTDSSPIGYSHARFIRKLRLSDCSMADVLDVFLAARVPLPCSTVKLEGIIPEYAPSIGRFLACVGDSLQHLSIDFKKDVVSRWEDTDDVPYFVAGGESFCTYVDLRKNTHLQTFRLNTIAYSCMATESTPALTMLPTILRGIVLPTSHIREIAFSFGFHSMDQLDVLPWGEMDRIMAPSEMLSSLRQLKLCFLDCNGRQTARFWEDLEAMIMKRLPRSCARLSVLFTIR
ncbi:hypothetical protein GGX14DRAFT_575185 [Mycena pura]|uniref:F-box domain-containing protein n=1 Tax=Mycena pura TaxID=153505 RepID=A0AAD6UWF3_9AGAR|nr:hypothetical protein GGX14DRAFT_575185 [Mycena pura]